MANNADWRREIERRAFKLCLIVYEATADIYSEEVLKKSIRMASYKIVADSATDETGKMFKEIIRTQKYLKIAQALGLVHPVNAILLRQKYQQLKEELLRQTGDESRKPETGDKAGENHNTPLPQKIEKKRRQNEIQDRRKKLLSLFKQGQKYKINDIAPLLLGKITARTIRNDIRDLTIAGHLKKEGSKRGSLYYITENKKD